MNAEAVQVAESPAYAVEFRDRAHRVYGEGLPSFTLVVADQAQLDRYLRADGYSAALAFVRGEVEVRGDLIAAIRFKMAQGRGGFKRWLVSALARFAPGRLETWFQSRARAARNIRFHYDRSNDFYRQFLDSHLQYSEAYYKDPSWSLEEAQVAKLECICRKLDLQPGERFLDVGCGWGGLVLHAAEHYRVTATGCTLSRRQFDYASEEAAARGLKNQVDIRETDYRDLGGTFDKITSVGMFEHVGRRRLRRYFEKLCSLLDDRGLFLNSGIARPQGVGDAAEALFLQRHVFPGGELPYLSDVVRSAEDAGLEVLEVENLRLHYALTCRDWVTRLERNAEACLKCVDAETYRTWVLYLAASALNFEEGRAGLYHTLMRKRRPYPSRRLTE